jgi:hypothetical protein
MGPKNGPGSSLAAFAAAGQSAKEIIPGVKAWAKNEVGEKRTNILASFEVRYVVQHLN